MKFLHQERSKAVQEKRKLPLVDDKNRAYLIDQLVMIHLHEMMKPETLHLSIAILDRGLLKMEI